MAEEINYTQGSHKNTHKLLWAVSGILVLLLVGNLVYFLVTSGNNSGNKNTPTSAANLTTIGTNSNSSTSSSTATKVNPSVVKETIPATATNPELQVSFEALDKILGVGEKCTQKQKFITKITSKSSEGAISLQFAQSDGYTTGQFDHTFTNSDPSFLNEYTWDTNTGTYYMDLNITSPVTKSFRVGFVNQCLN
jgi:hypothetical protein